jgi:hypothetical protein
MVGGHPIDWWLTPEDHWFFSILVAIFLPAAVGFLFISGVSASLSFKKNLNKPDSDRNRAKNIYLLRAFFLLIIAFLYNIPTAIVLNNLTWIWTWNVLQTVGFSLFLAWPLLKTSKTFRLILGIFLIILNAYILGFLLPYEGEQNTLGIFYHLLYNPLELYIIIPYFASFLIGTVIGDILFDINIKDNKLERENSFKKSFIFPLFIIGIFSIIGGVIFLFPEFTIHATISNMIYCLGIILSLLSVLIGIEEFKLIKVKKSYRFFFFYSYYSITIYLSHYLLYFLFYRQLNRFTVWVAVIETLIIFSLLIRAIYKKWGMKASVKVGLTILSFIIINKIEKKREIDIKKSGLNEELI